jgi:arginyl-tRNA synthetase
VLVGLREELTARLREVVQALAAERGVPAELHGVSWQRPTGPQWGDLTTPAALGLAKAFRARPREVAEALVARLALDRQVVDRVEVAGPGHINLRLAPGQWYEVVRTILAEGEAYGRSDVGRGRRIQVEFVSANPTGPLTVANGRGAALGDALANLLAAAGYAVEREYYVNDAGTQVAILGRSVLARYQEAVGVPADFPGDGYRGEYVRELAKALVEAEGRALLEREEREAAEACARFAVERLLAEIKADLEAFGVRFDRWFSERSLYEQGEVEATLRELEARGHLRREGGALWFRSTALGDDKDRVLVRSTGEPTYYASDVAYHADKFRRGFDRVVDIWGHDHHGYVGRMKAAVQGLGRDPDDLQIVLMQFVNLLRGGRPVAMGKREGEFVTLADLVGEVGKDVARFMFLTRRSDAPIDFDLEVAKSQSLENPVYYVQYAHARLCSVLREAAKANLPGPSADAPLARLDLPEELAMIRRLGEFPELVLGAAQSYEPHRVTVYLQDLAGALHSFYNKHRILSEDRDLSRARLTLVAALLTVLRNGLRLLGVEAPERM